MGTTNAAAFFDLDRTLISGAAAFPVGVEAWRQGVASNADIARWGIAALSFKLLGDKSDASSDDLKADFLSEIAGSPANTLDALATAVLPRLTHRVRPESRKLISMHHGEGRDTWIISASPQGLVEPLAVSLGMTGAIGTRGEIIDGEYTGNLDGPFVYGAGKVESIEKLASDRGYDMALCYAYSDSVSDLPMMEHVGHPVAVNPDSQLLSISRERGWPVVIFARRTKLAVAFGGVGIGTVMTSLLAYFIGRRHGRSKPHH
ncbi:MAG: HAD family hydrolase [Acidimicrobiia bacterium]